MWCHHVIPRLENPKRFVKSLGWSPGLSHRWLPNRTRTPSLLSACWNAANRCWVDQVEKNARTFFFYDLIILIIFMCLTLSDSLFSSFFFLTTVPSGNSTYRNSALFESFAPLGPPTWGGWSCWAWRYAEMMYTKFWQWNVSCIIYKDQIYWNTINNLNDIIYNIYIYIIIYKLTKIFPAINPHS